MITHFTKLIAWQKSHQLVLKIYTSTGQFPRYELFGLSNQLRRASVSITSNLAEGFRRRSIKDKIHFFSISRGSVSEVENQLMIARDLKYIDETMFSEFLALIREAEALIQGLINKLLGK